MLFRQTLLFLPAQLLPALCQFVALIAWSHLATPAVIGVVTLFTSVQEFLNTALMGFWNQYTARYVMKHSADAAGIARLRVASSAVVFVSVTVQIALGIGIYVVAIGGTLTVAMALALAGLVGARAINLFQAERARSRQDVIGYSVAVMSGPVMGFGIGLLLLWRYDSSALSVFAGFAVAQMLGLAFGLSRDRAWLGFGRPDFALIRHALDYGGPLIVSNILNWVTQNASRFAVSYFFGLSAVGIYSLGMGLGYRASVVSAMMVTAAAFPIAVRKANAGDVDGALRQLGANGALLFGVLAASLVGFALVSQDMLHLLVSKKMNGPVQPVMLWTMLAGALICLRNYFLNQVFLLQSVTRPIAIIAIVESIGSVVLAAIMVPLAGPVGGAAALALVSTISMTASFVLARRIGLVVMWDAIGRISLAALAMTIVVLAIPHAHTVLAFLGRIAAGGITFAAALGLLYRQPVAREVTRRVRLRRA